MDATAVYHLNPAYAAMDVIKLEDDAFHWPRDGGSYDYDYFPDYNSDLSDTASLSSGTHTREVSFEDMNDGDAPMTALAFVPSHNFGAEESVPSPSMLESYHPAQRDYSQYMLHYAAGTPNQWMRAQDAMAEQLIALPAPAAIDLPPLQASTISPLATGTVIPSALKPIADTMPAAVKAELQSSSPSPSPSPPPTTSSSSLTTSSTSSTLSSSTSSKTSHRVRQVGYKKPQNMRIQVNRLDISILLLRHQGDDGRHPNQQHVYYYQARIRNVYPQKHLWAGWETAVGVVDRVRAMAENFDDSFLDHAETRKSSSSSSSSGGASRRRKREC